MSVETQSQEWQDVNHILDGASKAGTLDYLQDLSDLMGYDYGNIRFESMPDNVGGYTHTDYDVKDDGEIVINGNEIYLNERLLPGSHEESLVPVPSLFRDSIDFYDDAVDGLQDTFYHELGHGTQYRDIWDAEEPYTEDELAALLPLHEGQASYNADDASYRDMNTFYEAFIDSVYEEDEAPGKVLQELSEQYRIDVVYLEDGEDGVYDFVVTDRDDDLGEDEIYELAEDAYGMDVLAGQSYEVDYRDFDMDKIGEHMVRVQDQLDEGYENVADVYGADALPTGYTDMIAEQDV